MAEPKQCFVIAPIGDDESKTRKRSDKVLKHIIRPVVDEHGYQAMRADELAEPGMITTQIIQRLVDDPLVVADLTEHNPNVFYELAIRHAVRKPLVQLIEKGERLPFDVAPMRTIEVDIEDLDSVGDAKLELGKQIENLKKDPASLQTPVSFTIDLSRLRESGDPEERSLAEVVTALADVRSSIVNLERYVQNPEMILPPEYLHMFLRASRSDASTDRAMSEAMERTEIALACALHADDAASRERHLLEALDVITSSGARHRSERRALREAAARRATRPSTEIRTK